MANRHRRHSSLDTLGWMYSKRDCDEAPPSLESSRTSSSAVRTLKVHSSARLHRGEYFTSCFGPRDSGPVSQRPILSDPSLTPTSTTRCRPRSRSLGTFDFDFGSLCFKEKSAPMDASAAELNPRAATHQHRLAQTAGRWVMEDDEEYYMKPPAWKQALRKLRAEAKRHVHRVRALSPVNYDMYSYEKNFDDGGRSAVYMQVDEDADEFGEKARIRHSMLLTRLHSQRFEGEDAATGTTFAKTSSVPAVLPVKVFKGSEDGLPIWERRDRGRPIAKLELSRSPSKAFR